MAAHGEVLYQSSQNDATNSDIWDDTALVKAYDKAINSIKTQVNSEQNVEEPEENNVEVSAKKATKKGRQKRKKRKPSHKQKWKVGSQCSAVFADDNLVYNAVLKSVNYKLGTCWVTFKGYGNEEEKNLDELMAPVHETLSQDEGSSCMENGYESVDMDTFRTESPHYPSNRSYPSSSPYYPPSGPPAAPPWQYGHPPPPWTTPSFHHPYDHVMATPPPPPPGPFHKRGPWGLPQPPPPPPLDGESDQDALYAMLMAWYMSGYHTGYFQGLRGAKKKHSSRASSER